MAEYKLVADAKVHDLRFDMGNVTPIGGSTAIVLQIRPDAGETIDELPRRPATSRETTCY